MATVSIAPARSRRLVEVLLLLLALAVGIGGYVLASLNYTGALPANLFTHVAVLVVLAVVAEVGVHFLAPCPTSASAGRPSACARAFTSPPPSSWRRSS